MKERILKNLGAIDIILNGYWWQFKYKGKAYKINDLVVGNIISNCDTQGQMAIETIERLETI